MPAEKAFAINASPEEVWDELRREIEEAPPESRAIEEEERPRLLRVRVRLSGAPATITYRITPRDIHTEVSAQMQIWGFRHAVFSILTLGRVDTGYELALVQGLYNLKVAVEGRR